MLLQSHKDYIAILPALPQSWKDGEISGLRARGNMELSMKWSDGKLREGTVKSLCGGRCNLKYDGKILLVYDEEGKELETSFSDGVTSFTAEKDKSYKFN